MLKSKGAFILRYTGVNVWKPFSIPLVTEVRRFALVIGARGVGGLCQVESVSRLPAMSQDSIQEVLTEGHQPLSRGTEGH